MLRRVRETIVAVEKQLVLYICVCVFVCVCVCARAPALACFDACVWVGGW
jgi:hypothetical protein